MELMSILYFSDWLSYWLAGLIVSGFGLIRDILVRLIGAIFSRVGLNLGGRLGTILAATIGAVILPLIVVRRAKRVPAKQYVCSRAAASRSSQIR